MINFYSDINGLEASLIKKLLYILSGYCLLWSSCAPMSSDTASEVSTDAIMEAVIMRKHSDLRRLSLDSVTVDATATNRYTPVAYAARLGDTTSLRLLLQAGGSPDTPTATLYGSTPLHEAINAGATAAVKLLVEAGADIDRTDRYGDTPINWAAYYGHTDIVAYLHRQQARIDQAGEYRVGAFELALLAFEDEAAAVLAPHIAHSTQTTRAWEALQQGDTAALRASLIPDDVVHSTNNLGQPLLSYAIKIGDDAATDILLSHGADASQSDAVGYTPLIYAAHYGRTDAAAALLLAGADVDASAFGRTALMEAARQGKVEVGILLVRAGATLDAQEQIYGYTALHWAALGDREPFIKMLLDNGSSAGITSKRGLFPADLARGNIVELLAMP